MACWPAVQTESCLVHNPSGSLSNPDLDLSPQRICRQNQHQATDRNSMGADFVKRGERIRPGLERLATLVSQLAKP